ncbi:MAG: AAA family ATPase [Proteobacteria bacterium]|nr:AAA family ATPase [Pseudomonadota bacterium]NBP13983.1 AAA family ATPase [bacterium]
MDVNKVWTEKYRPNTLDDIVLSDDTRKILKSFIKDDEIPNLLFCGHAGIGKTTTAKVLIQTLDAENIYKNCSEVGIDIVRNDITGFSRTKSFNGKKKIVLLDEVDGMASTEAQRSLRNVLEEYAGHCRFILTCNYKHRVIVPLQSRCQSIDLDPQLQEVVKRCYNILKSENVSVTEESKKKLIGLVRRYFPDIRKCVNELQKYSTSKTLEIPDLNIKDEFAAKIIQLVVSKKVLIVRKVIIENESTFNGDYGMLMKALFDAVYTGNYSLNEAQKKLWLVTIGEYMYRSAFALDQEINFYCLLIALSEITA